MPKSSESPVDRLVRLLQLEQLDRDLFLGDPGPGEGRLFGGMVAAQAVMAAGRTVDHGSLHSLHAYFLRPGHHKAPIRYAVYRIRDGRTFTSRDVVAYQSGEAIFSISTSFAVPEEGPTHQEPMPEAPDPETVPTEESFRHSTDEGERRWMRDNPVDTRHVYPPASGVAAGELPRRMVWFRLKGEMPEDPLLHTAGLVFASDRGLLGTAAWAQGPRRRGMMTASLDHALWIHEQPRMNDWLLYTSYSPGGAAARAVIFGAMYRRDGTRVATVAQEGLVRRPPA